MPRRRRERDTSRPETETFNNLLETRPRRDVGASRESRPRHWDRNYNLGGEYTAEPSMYAGDAACCQITLTTCYNKHVHVLANISRSRYNTPQHGRNGTASLQITSRTQQARRFYRWRGESSPTCVVCGACGGPGGSPLGSATHF